MNNAFIFPNFVVDEHLRALSEEELKALVVCYRFNTHPTNENLSNFGLSSDVLDDALEKVGIITEAKAKSLIKASASFFNHFGKDFRHSSLAIFPFFLAITVIDCF